MLQIAFSNNVSSCSNFIFPSHWHAKLTEGTMFLQHGEPGAAVVDLQPVDVIVSHVLKQILSTVSLLGLILSVMIGLGKRTL